MSRYMGLRRNYSYRADLALRSSLGFHGVDRVGLEPPLFVHQGNDTVSASRLRMNLQLLGQGYFAAAQPLLYDIADLIHHDKPRADITLHL